MSATLASLLSDTLALTKRPDRVASCTRAVQNALIKAHTRDYWLQDLLETNFLFNVAAPIYQLDYKSLIPRWRKAKYLTYIDPVTLQFIAEHTPIALEQFMDSYGYIRVDTWYQAGSQLQIRTSGSQTVFGLGVYLYPDITLASPSWIADEIPDAVVYEAARREFKAMGFDEQSAEMGKMVTEAYQQLTIVGVPTVGS